MGDKLDEFKKELSESDEDGPDFMIEGEPVEYLLDSMSGAGVLCGIREAWSRRVGWPIRRVRSTEC